MAERLTSFGPANTVTTMRTLLLVGTVALAFTSIGCPGPTYPNCRNDDDCHKDPKEYCVNGKCQQCRDSKDCPAGQSCKEGRCEAAGCSDDSACPAGQSCIDGSCKPCASDDQCGAGGKCQGGKCQRAKKCGKDDDCAQDEECRGGVCQSGVRKAPPPAACTADPVYFDFNESSITTEGSATLQRNADCIKKTNRAVQLIGHTDNRGTEEYNLALSNQRAASVKNYLTSLGVKTTVTTEGRGKIDARGTDEAGFAKDRRVDTEWK